MQYPKDEIRKVILDAAAREYLAVGFRCGNIKKIAAESGVAVGNIYRYFDGKTGILDAIVSRAYSELPMLVQEAMGQNDRVGALADMVCGYQVPLSILVRSCACTRYEDFVVKMVDKLAPLFEGETAGTIAYSMLVAISQQVGAPRKWTLDILKFYLGE